MQRCLWYLLIFADLVACGQAGWQSGAHSPKLGGIQRKEPGTDQIDAETEARPSESDRPTDNDEGFPGYLVSPDSLNFITNQSDVTIVGLPGAVDLSGVDQKEQVYVALWHVNKDAFMRAAPGSYLSANRIASGKVREDAGFSVSGYKPKLGFALVVSLTKRPSAERLFVWQSSGKGAVQTIVNAAEPDLESDTGGETEGSLRLIDQSFWLDDSSQTDGSALPKSDKSTFRLNGANASGLSALTKEVPQGRFAVEATFKIEGPKKGDWSCGLILHSRSVKKIAVVGLGPDSKQSAGLALSVEEKSYSVGKRARGIRPGEFIDGIISLRVDVMDGGLKIYADSNNEPMRLVSERPHAQFGRLNAIGVGCSARSKMSDAPLLVIQNWRQIEK